jgi:glycosyltransferase involved in cell wall biosynthesis
MKLSIIVPAHNRERYIGAALRSLLRQRDDASLDIIVVDDGSTDGTSEIIETMMHDAPEIRLFRQPQKKGVSAARNLALRQLPPDTEFVSFLDSDDVSPAGRFSTDLAYFGADPGLDLTYSQICEIDRIDDEKLEPAEDCRVRISRGIQLAAGIYRRELIDALGGFDEGFVQAEDTDFLFRLFERSPRYVFPETIAVYYRRHAESLTAHRREMRSEFLRACLKSTLRRKRDPSLENPYPLVNMTDPNVEGSRT